VSGGPRGGGVGIHVGGGWKKAAEWSETEAWAGARRRAVGLGAAGVPCAARGRRREEEGQTETRLSGRLGPADRWGHGGSGYWVVCRLNQCPREMGITFFLYYKYKRGSTKRVFF
jgi:hypothetical protein